MKMFALFFLIGSAQASQLQFTGLSSGDLKNITKEFSANFMHTSVSGGATLGSLYGFEVGVIGGLTSTPNIETLVYKASPATTIGTIPNAAVLGALTIPLGFTFETNFIPQVGSSDIKFSNFSLAVKWTLTEIFFPELPFSLGAKLFYNHAQVNGNTQVSGIPTTLQFTDNITGLTAFISKDFILLEPYLGFGVLQGQSTLSTGTGSVFASQSNSASSTASGINFVLGSELKFGLFKMGFEYANILGANRYTGKLAFYF